MPLCTQNPPQTFLGDCGGLVWFALGFCEANGQEGVGADSISARGVLRRRKIARGVEDAAPYGPPQSLPCVKGAF